MTESINVSQFPRRADGMLHFHRYLELIFSQHTFCRGIGTDFKPTGSHFVAAVADLKGPALDGFLDAAGWWITRAIKAGPMSAEEFGRILRDAGIVSPEASQ